MPTMSMGLRTTWHWPASATTKTTRRGTPILSDGTLDGSFKWVIRSNERQR